ncbi:MAG: hypothetical protein RIC14_00645 [Filomicrobium sp.]
MVSKSHTPGPWKWWTSNSYRRLTSEAERTGPDGGVLRATHQRDGTGDVLVSEADMGLIAASPDLLAALRDCRTWMREQHDEFEGDLHFDMALEKADAAIAKATTPVHR